LFVFVVFLRNNSIKSFNILAEHINLSFKVLGVDFILTKIRNNDFLFVDTLFQIFDFFISKTNHRIKSFNFSRKKRHSAFEV